METVNCIRCDFRHKDNGNCTAVGGSCTAVPAAHCPILRMYLDTGLTPEEVNDAVVGAKLMAKSKLVSAFGVPAERLRELVEADKAGRVVVLPAKTVYELVWDAGSNCDGICPVSIDGVGCCDFCDAGELYIYEAPCKQEHIGNIGKTVFLTREEAEKALEAMKDG